MEPQLSPGTFNAFFAWAPWVIGIVIYFAFYVAKRHEGVAVTVPAAHAPAAESSYACTNCGRRGSLAQMVAQEHGGAVSWYCGDCAAQSATALGRTPS
jgi:hypothetical protein